MHPAALWYETSLAVNQFGPASFAGKGATRNSIVGLERITELPLANDARLQVSETRQEAERARLFEERSL
jgi:hypothetical protein